jgi:hypothetical protein
LEKKFQTNVFWCEIKGNNIPNFWYHN